jgi:hypothetical protein
VAADEAIVERRFMLTPNQVKAIDACEAGDYGEALQLLDLLSAEERRHPRLLFVLADSLYEIGDDLGALEVYVQYLVRFPKGRRKNFALMGIAVILKNLELENEALGVLRLVDPEHEGLEKELEDSRNTLALQMRAREILGPMCGALGVRLEEGR